MQIQKNIFSLGKRLTQVPKHLIYERRKYWEAHDGAMELVAFTTGKNKATAEMICSKRDMQFVPDYDGKCVFINYITSEKTGVGLGTALINFAKKLSYKKGCNGYLLLSADASFAPQRVPHLFYRKMGFETWRAGYNSKMDRFIKKGKHATKKDFRTCLMVYNPNKLHQKSNNKNVFFQIARSIKSFFYA